LKLGKTELGDARDSRFAEMEDLAGTQREFHVAVIQGGPLGQAKPDELSGTGHDGGFGRVAVGPLPPAIARRGRAAHSFATCFFQKSAGRHDRRKASLVAIVGGILDAKDLVRRLMGSAIGPKSAGRSAPLNQWPWRASLPRRARLRSTPQA
jgi:hypothetical protein